ncbi:MAG: 2-C-methyl-D-erythritol 4-phosphate cytidylyltransferase [Algoriphagus sp.]|jgi:2-C-methyl-D-erythritol 4-phosphate cytidylyltransferase|uniref:2-C-methyl-D-erythritol 4-phosphate cytidylyltransferase n=1 Tax=Algoriphagus sp. TaxID=1872435 RepID=UPI0027617660|nr:2-C-methyl-D-erythritol 4-phosphate cytidylyltransferase [Algoriphagus sp.]MDP4838367.1 2-C-methyl-D-erythritol 4-phosphate cytidylyltransferase [Algoriphagus sp.]MDP4903950.1 2-C-methyl-D-erythritol 4-phosphate cytidylyltransferase [Algoriphagus sp.]MDP4956943.1 2-C-methyl-D-erythritol 4-phosphate cytidylyltransferase [Algoriphagus sp.]MDP5126457.1 2-C-methyl-D-erythritol 4-phosphate cytidylyltransferase [Algoriphagus sp.]
MNKAAVIVAGGKGMRMGGSLSKQYLPLAGKPIVMHTLEKFHASEPSVYLMLVLPHADFDYWKGLCDSHNFTLPHQLVAGGASRFQSVKNGLLALPFQEGLVAIHDGVRPFVSEKVIQTSFEKAEEKGSAIPVVALKDSLRKVDTTGESSFQDRAHFRLVQTPQTFQLKPLLQAFSVEELAIFSDDATVYEHQGWEVSLIEGNPENIKLTTPEDLSFAEFLMTTKVVD